MEIYQDVWCMQLGNESVVYDQLKYRIVLNEQTSIPQLPVKVQKTRTVTQDFLMVPLHACLVWCRRKVSLLISQLELSRQ